MLQIIKINVLRWLKNSQIRFITFLVIAVCLIMSIVGYIAYHSSISILRNALSEPQAQMLSIGMQAVDDIIHEADNMAIQVMIHSRTKNFVSDTQDMNVDELSSYVNYLNNIMSSSSYFESIYVYDIDRDRVASSNPYGYSSNSALFPDRNWIADTELLEQGKALVKLRAKEKGRSTSEQFNTVSLMRLVTINNKAEAVVLINMAYDDLFSRMNYEHLSELSSLKFIIDQQQQMIVVSDQLSMNDSQLHSLLTSQADSFISTLVTEEQKKFIVTGVQSPMTEWYYYSVIPADQLFADLASIRNSTIGLSLIAIIVGISCLILISYRSTKPIKRMRHLINDDRAGALGWDEWADITVNLTKDIGKLNRVLKQSQQELQKKWLHDAINGYLLDHHLQSRFQTHFNNWNEQSYHLSVISIDNFRSFLVKYNESDQNLFKYALLNVIEEFYSHFARAVCIDSEKDHFIVYYQSDKEELDREQLHQLHQELIATIENLFRMSVSVGLSSSSDKPSAVVDSYEEALVALSQRLYEGYSFIHDVLKVGMGQEPPNIIELDVRNLLVQLKQAQYEKVAEQLQHYCEKVSKQLVPAAKVLDQIDSFLNEIHLLVDEKEMNSLEFLDGYRTNLLQTMTIEDIEQLLLQVSEHLSQYFKQRSQAKDSRFVEQMKQFIHEHYSEQIGIQDVADSIQVSVSLANQLFKTQAGKTIYDYITDYRISQAEYLLLNTSYKVNEISMKVGYLNENSFIRVFRKATGLTPGKYRLQHEAN